MHEPDGRKKSQLPIGSNKSDAPLSGEARPLTFCAGYGREGSVPRTEELLVEFPLVCEVGSLSM